MVNHAPQDRQIPADTVALRPDLVRVLRTGGA